MAVKCPKCQFENPEDTFYCGKCATPLPSNKDISVSQTETLQTPIKELTTGSTFAGRYQIIEELGKGGMGRVYKAFDTDVKEKVALKLLKPEIASDREMIERFSNELKFARKISHRNVCRMYDLGKEAGNYFITMEYVSGEDLKSFIRRSRQLVVGTAIFIARQVCEGLAEAHRLGVVHRDLKPGNIMIDRDGNAKIMDFGIARSVSVKGITGTGVLIGTPEYMSPEQVEGKEADQRSDIYSLGIILFEMLTGQVPFEGDTPFAISVKHKSEIPKNPRELNAQIPDNLCGVVLKCLEKAREKRYQCAEELDSDLTIIGKEIQKREQKILLKKVPTSKEITVQFRLKKVIVPALIFISIIIIGVGVWRLLPRKQASEPPGPPSVAVLPFEDLSPQKDQEYFCDGMAEELITNLSKIQVLKVISRTSAMQYKGVKKPLPQIARELGVEEIVEGAVLRVGDKVRISAKLIHAANDQTQWAETYERDLHDVLSLQAELAQAIVSEIRIKLTPQEKTRLVATHRVDPEAYEAYLRAMQEAGKWTNEAIEKSIAYLKQSIQKDSEYAPSHAALAGTYCSQAIRGLDLPTIALPKAKIEAIRALELDDTLADVHDTLGLLKWRYDWDFSSAEMEIRRAIELSPNDAGVHGGYANYLAVMGRFDEAIKERLKAEELDPTSLGSMRGSAWTFYQARRWDESISRFKKALELSPNQPLELALLAGTYGYKGAKADSIAAAEKARQFVAPGKEQMLDAYLAGPYSQAGKRSEVLQWIELWERLSTQHHVESFLMACMNAPLGNRDKAFEWLEKAFEERSVNMPFLLIHPLLDTLHSDRRFQDLVRRVGFPGH